jgi:hypothetical protein
MEAVGCNFHAGKSTHSALACHRTYSENKQLGLELRICFVCQKRGHAGYICPCKTAAKTIKKLLEEKEEQPRKRTKPDSSRNVRKTMAKAVSSKCQFHKSKSVQHLAIVCRLPKEVKKEKARQMKICYICQKEGHQGFNCPYKGAAIFLKGDNSRKQHQSGRKTFYLP